MKCSLQQAIGSVSANKCCSFPRPKKLSSVVSQLLKKLKSEDKSTICGGNAKQIQGLGTLIMGYVHFPRVLYQKHFGGNEAYKDPRCGFAKKNIVSMCSPSD